MFWNIRSYLSRVYSCCFIFFMFDDLLDKLETRNENEKWGMRNEKWFFHKTLFYEILKTNRLFITIMHHE